MAKYLLSVVQPDGEPPAPDVLDPIMERVARFDARAGELVRRLRPPSPSPCAS